MPEAGVDRPITLVMIRHSKSCSNYLRGVAASEDRDHPLVHASQNLLDPALSAVGRKMAEHYAPTIRRRLAAAGIKLDTALIGSSGLRRAEQTAQILFPGHTIAHLPNIKEQGNIPENTPATRRRCKPDWRAFLRHLHGRRDHDQFVVVGHGSYLRNVAWPAVSATGRPRPEWFGNLDGFIVSATLTAAGDLKNPRVRELLAAPPRSITGADDRCSVAVESKISAYRRTMKGRRSHGKRKTQKRKSQQRGGAATPLPLGYFQDGAQMRGTYAEPTGVGLAAPSAAWIRYPVTQTGGSKRRTHKRQGGGFSPSVMGAFVTNGMRLLPAAGYVGYKMFKNQRRTRQTR